MSKRIGFKVTGSVQGVNFRAWSTDKANKLGVTGFIQNMPDRSVTGEAQGDQSALDKFVQHLQVGPQAARVGGVEQKDMSTKDGETEFKQ